MNLHAIANNIAGCEPQSIGLFFETIEKLEVLREDVSSVCPSCTDRLCWGGIQEL